MKAEVMVVTVGYLSGIVGACIGFLVAVFCQSAVGRRPKPRPKTRAEHVKAWVAKTERTRVNPDTYGAQYCGACQSSPIGLCDRHEGIIDVRPRLSLEPLEDRLQ